MKFYWYYYPAYIFKTFIDCINKISGSVLSNEVIFFEKEWYDENNYENDKHSMQNHLWGKSGKKHKFVAFYFSWWWSYA